MGSAVAVVGLPVAVIALVLGGAGADATDSLGGTVVGGLNLAVMPAAGRQYAPWYIKASQSVARECPQLAPALLAAQGYQESGFNATIEGPATAYGTAKGIAQFIDSTWATWGADADGDGTALGARDPEDAIMAQARYMCSMVKKAARSYGGDPVRLALAGYNAGWGRVEEYGGVPPESFAEGQTYNYVRIITATAAKWSRAGQPLSAEGWTKPVAGPLGTAYHESGAHWASGYHTGVDFVVAVGTTVRAAGPGTVVRAGVGVSYGNEIIIRHDDGVYTQYAHLSALSVSEGATVKGGQTIGLSGATGNVTGPHLHFEIRTGLEYGSDISPLPYLRKRGVTI
ncbi:peptidoglycan DD-metalloendopeptidase family protein [Streptomyces sp. IB2014 011-1]|uniref:peptidoglycan DD-metalloendopeptidase family protein n=1 Tax=Streptomyces sp. IB2014 011-1 TaxID=1844478 RepID=UPI0009D52763|nr:peptidoglycan DD-metalloendopeptidase family protein [Streptomyces sp. IB2014 011-1]ONI48497.1 Glycyl-glycine endopeptidase ALE-1 [Streptomyces sp. IB2014 011-1]